MKNSITPTGIESATFRFVAQHLTLCATAVQVMYENNVFNLLLVFMIEAFGTKLIKEMNLCPQDIPRRCDILLKLWAFQTEDGGPDVINDGF